MLAGQPEHPPGGHFVGDRDRLGHQLILTPEK